MYKDKQGDRGRSSRAPLKSKDERMDIMKIMKDIEVLGSSHMTWKEKKALENKKVVSLGGKPQKQQRLPLSVAKGRMKKQKEREQKMLQERMILGCFGGKYGGGGPKRSEVKRRPEDQVLKSSEGHFRNGVLNVKHLLHQTPSRESNAVAPMFKFNEGKKKVKGKGKGKKNKGKKGGGKKRH
ncbi:hypothetical protein L484_013553 [Morus notabilis]|uniref:Axoneme-associated protein MST101(2) protein n=2 Tax=Morus notabilis TaxID=981085 RepID=W9QRW5_9ROSA|nr:hypothetical protein L484_013553 [Morus notabilis]